MLPTLQSLADAPPADSGFRPLTRAYLATAIGAAAAIVAMYLVAFPIEYRHPIDVIDLIRESVNFLGVLAVAIWMRRDIRPLNIGFSILLVSLWMEVWDEITAEPHWMGTIVPAMLGMLGVALIGRASCRERVLFAV